MPRLVYDSGALVAAERRDKDIWGLHEEALAAGVVPFVPVVVLAQAWRGGPQPLLSRFLHGCVVVPDDEIVGRAAGKACALAGISDVVDAIVVVTAIGGMVATSDPRDLARLAEAVGVRLTIRAV